MAQTAAASPATIGLDGRISLVLVASLTCIGFAGLAPILPQISKHFAATPGAETIVRSMITMLGGAMAIGAPVAGMLAERYGETRLLRAALLLFAAAGMAGWLIDDIWLLLASRILVGLALVTTGVMALTLLSSGLGSADRNKWLGFFGVVSSLAVVAIMPLIAYVASIDWRLVFLLHVIALPVLLLVVLFVPAAPVVAGDDRAATDAGGGRIPVGMLFLGIACGAVGATMPAYLAFHFVEIGHPQPTTVATGLMVMTLAAATASSLYGWVRRHFEAVPVFIAGFVTVGLALLFMTIEARLATSLAGLALVGFCSGWIGGTLFAVAATARPERRARRIGWARGGYYGSPLVAQIVLEPVAIRYGPHGAFFTIAGFALVMALVIFAIRSGFRETPVPATA